MDNVPLTLSEGVEIPQYCNRHKRQWIEDDLKVAWEIITDPSYIPTGRKGDEKEEEFEGPMDLSIYMPEWEEDYHATTNIVESVSDLAEEEEMEAARREHEGSGGHCSSHIGARIYKGLPDEKRVYTSNSAGLLRLAELEKAFDGFVIGIQASIDSMNDRTHANTMWEGTWLRPGACRRCHEDQIWKHRRRDYFT